MSETSNTQADKPARPSVLATRRQFISLGAATIGAAWAGTLVQGQLFPQSTSQEARPVEVAAAELPVGAVKYITYAGTPAILIRTAESIKAFSLICTHLGCTIQWQEAEGAFYCPCHDGRFDKFGEVTAGPPPVPLEQFTVTVTGDKIIVGELA